MISSVSLAIPLSKPASGLTSFAVLLRFEFSARTVDALSAATIWPYLSNVGARYMNIQVRWGGRVNEVHLLISHFERDWVIRHALATNGVEGEISNRERSFRRRHKVSIKSSI